MAESWLWKGDELDDHVDRHHHALATVTFLHGNFPTLARHIPLDAQPFSRGYGVGDGMSTHPAIVSSRWLVSNKGTEFTRDRTVPDGFVAIGIKYTGAAEYVFAMLRLGENCLWLRAKHVDYNTAESNYEEARRDIDAALLEWPATSGR